MASWQTQASELWAALPNSDVWRSVASDMHANYIFHGAVIYIVMQPILKAVFATRSRSTGAIASDRKFR